MARVRPGERAAHGPRGPVAAAGLLSSLSALTLDLLTLALLRLPAWHREAMIDFGDTGRGPDLLLVLVLAHSGVVAAVLLAAATVVQWRRLSAPGRAVRIVLRAALLAAVAWVNGAYWGASEPLALMDLGLQRRVRRGSDLDRLDAWALQVLERPAAVPVDRRGDVDLSRPPDFVQRLRPRWIDVQGDTPAWRDVRIGWGGGFHHWGILLGPPGFRAESYRGDWLHRWRDGVYGWQERQ